HELLRLGLLRYDLPLERGSPRFERRLPVPSRAPVPEEEAEVRCENDPRGRDQARPLRPDPPGLVHDFIPGRHRTVTSKECPSGTPFSGVDSEWRATDSKAGSRANAAIVRTTLSAFLPSRPMLMVVSPVSSKCGVSRVTRTSGGRVLSSLVKRLVQENLRSPMIFKRPRLS